MPQSVSGNWDTLSVAPVFPQLRLPSQKQFRACQCLEGVLDRGQGSAGMVSIKEEGSGTGVTNQLVRVLAGLAKDLGSIPSTQWVAPKL